MNEYNLSETTKDILKSALEQLITYTKFLEEDTRRNNSSYIDKVLLDLGIDAKVNN